MFISLALAILCFSYLILPHLVSYDVEVAVGLREPVPDAAARTTPATIERPAYIPPNTIAPAWPESARFSLSYFLTDSAEFPESQFDIHTPVLTHRGLQFEYRAAPLESTIDVPITADHRANASELYLHALLMRDPALPSRADGNWARCTAQIVLPVRYKVERQLKYLFDQPSGDSVAVETSIETSVAPVVEAKYEYAPSFRPNVTLQLVYDFTHFPGGAALPDPIRAHVRVTRDELSYAPIVFVNDMWFLKEWLVRLDKDGSSFNTSAESLPLGITFDVTSMWRFQMSIGMSTSLQQMQSSEESNADDFKRILLETNPYFLALTVFVTILHMTFDTLAFKNEITFWNGKKNFEGLSLKTVFVNIGMQGVILLYLFDNETSWMILLSASVGLVIEVWKLTKCTDVQLQRQFPFVRFIENRTYSQSKTKEYDEVAMRYLMYILFPCITIYALWSLVYQQHRSLYSWLIGSLVSSIYMFGFIMMTPQLFINYKLKSVAHLPFRVFVYKALNTFVDDMFAFIIKMPMLHRLACLRDDVIFFIFLYQRYIYRVDKTRVNEFGQSFVSDANSEVANKDKVE